MKEATKKHLFIILRFLILVLLPLAIAFYFYFLVERITKISVDIRSLVLVGQEKDACISVGKGMNALNNPEILKKTEERVGSLIKLPKSFFKYYFYVENNFLAHTKDNQTVYTKFNLTLNNDTSKYKEIKFDEKEKIFNVPDIGKFELFQEEHSFRYYFSNSFEEKDTVPKDTQVAPLEDNKFIYFYFRPTFFTSFIVFLFCLVFWYGILSLINLFYKFIAFGKPFRGDN